MNDEYRHKEEINYLGDFPGARRERDRIAIEVEESVALDVVNNIDRLLGAVRPYKGSTWAVEPVAGDLFPVDVDGPIDVSAAAIPIQDPIDASEAPLEIGAWSAGPLDASEAPIDVADRAGRDLGAVSTDQPDHGVAEIDGATLAADGSITRTIQAAGATELVGTVSSTGQYDVSVEWQTTGGTTLRTDSIVTDEAGGTPTALDVAAGAAVAVITITDKSSAEQTAKGGVTLA